MPDDLLADKYPLRKKRGPKQEIDPDHGAACDWVAMKGSLKARAEAMKAVKGKTARRRR